MTNLDKHIKKQRHCQLKSILSELWFLPVVMYGCKSWTIKKVECWRIDAFELWCWRRLLRVPWTARRSNQSILKEISSDCSLEGLMLKLKLQYSGHLMRRNNSLRKTLMLGKIKGRRRGQQSTDAWMYHQLNGHDFKQTQEVVRDRKIWCAAVHGFTKSSTWLSGWTTTTVYINLILKYMSSIWSSPL